MSGRDYHVDIAGNFEVAFDGEADLMRHMAMRTAVPDASIDQCPAGPEHDRTRPGGGAGGQTGSAATKGSSVPNQATRSEEHTSELQSLMRISYAVFCLKKKNKNTS